MLETGKSVYVQCDVRNFIAKKTLSAHTVVVYPENGAVKEDTKGVCHACIFDCSEIKVTKVLETAPNGDDYLFKGRARIKPENIDLVTLLL